MVYVRIIPHARNGKGNLNNSLVSTKVKKKKQTKTKLHAYIMYKTLVQVYTCKMFKQYF